MPKQYVDIFWNPKQHRKTPNISMKNDIDYNTPAPTRAIDMLLAKLRGDPFKTDRKSVV